MIYRKIWNSLLNALKNSSKFFLKLLLSISVLIGFYLISSIILSVIPVNRSNQINDEIDIFIKSNGIHLDIVLPLKNDIKDWTNEIYIDKRIKPIANYISFGWGDKGFYKDAPQWSDLKFGTASKALFIKSPSAFHINYHKDLEVYYAKK